MTQRNAAMVEETVAAIQSLNEDVSDVSTRVARFELQEQDQQQMRRYG